MNRCDVIVVSSVVDRFFMGLLASDFIERININGNVEPELRMKSCDVSRVAKASGIVQHEFPLKGAILQGLIEPLDNHGEVLKSCTLEDLFKSKVEIFRLQPAQIVTFDGKDGVLPPFVLKGFTVKQSEQIIIRTFDLLADCQKDKESWVTPPKGGIHAFLKEQLDLNPLHIKPILDRTVDTGICQDNGKSGTYRRWRIAQRCTVTEEKMQEMILASLDINMEPYGEIVAQCEALKMIQSQLAALEAQCSELLEQARVIIKGRLAEKKVLL